MNTVTTVLLLGLGFALGVMYSIHVVQKATNACLGKAVSVIHDNTQAMKAMTTLVKAMAEASK